MRQGSGRGGLCFGEVIFLEFCQALLRNIASCFVLVVYEKEGRGNQLDGWVLSRFPIVKVISIIVSLNHHPFECQKMRRYRDKCK